MEPIDTETQLEEVNYEMQCKLCLIPKTIDRFGPYMTCLECIFLLSNPYNIEDFAVPVKKK